MEKYYKGLRENGVWERFISDRDEDATAEVSGYEAVEEITKEEFDNMK